MGIFNELFGGKKSGIPEEQNALTWIPLTSVDQLTAINEKSAVRAQLIFKHSTSCGISRMVWRMFSTSPEPDAHSMELYYLDIHSYREVSNRAAQLYGVRHESPQLLVIKDGTVIANASHAAISTMPLKELL